MITATLLLLFGLALVLAGAGVLVNGASSIARKGGISEFVIGLTIIAIGTSAPEMVVSLIASIRGNADMAAGNIVGSNIFNTALILGLTAVISPIVVTRSNLRRDFPLNMGVTLLLVLTGLKHTLTGIGFDGLCRIEGVVFLLLFGWYMYRSFKETPETFQHDDTASAPMSWSRASVFVCGGMVALILGGRLFVSQAGQIAQMLGLSDKFIAVTVLALGTSLPELATSCVAAARGKSQMALGNIIGSNVANILLILGSAAVIRPLHMEHILIGDYAALMLCALLLAGCAYRHPKGRINRMDGILLLTALCAYLIWLTATSVA